MVQLERIISFLNEKAPSILQEAYDNSGLILGNPGSIISRVLVCLDADYEAVKKAAELNCQLVISHHPPIFRAVKVFTDETSEGRLLSLAIKNNIALYSSHTNYDSVCGGLTDQLCRKIGLFDIKVLKKSPISPEHGFGRYGHTELVSGREFISRIKKALDLDVVRYVGEIPDTVTLVAVFNGSYDREILHELQEIKPDLLLTGDLKYHDARELMEKGIFTVDAGHFGTEKHFVESMTELLRYKFPQLDIVSYEGEDVFSYHTDE